MNLIKIKLMDGRPFFINRDKIISFGQGSRAKTVDFVISALDQSDEGPLQIVCYTAHDVTQEDVAENIDPSYMDFFEPKS